MLQGASKLPETCNESDGLWLPLIEYSVKSGVSLSTIRRKIKNNSIHYRLEKGKYLILYNEANNMAARQAPQVPEPVPSPSRVSHEDDSWSIKMISEAFELALKEKDERIRLLEQHLNELRLLVRVLEEKYEVRY